MPMPLEGASDRNRSGRFPIAGLRGIKKLPAICVTESRLCVHILCYGLNNPSSQMKPMPEFYQRSHKEQDMQMMPSAELSVQILLIDYFRIAPPFIFCRRSMQRRVTFRVNCHFMLYRSCLRKSPYLFYYIICGGRGQGGFFFTWEKRESLK